MAFVRFMSQPAGRMIRAVLGLALIALGFFAIGGTAGILDGRKNPPPGTHRGAPKY